MVSSLTVYPQFRYSPNESVHVFRTRQVLFQVLESKARVDALWEYAAERLVPFKY